MIAGLMKMMKKENGDPKPIAQLTKDELTNILEQDRLIRDAAIIHKMLLTSYRTTFVGLKAKYKLPEEFMFDKGTGEFFEKEKDDG